MDRIAVRKGMPDVQLAREEFERRLRNRFFDPAFKANEEAIKAIIETAWNGYAEYRKSPVTRRAGPEFAFPEEELSVEWLETRERIKAAEARFEALRFGP